jgi:hypothetical protein
MVIYLGGVCERDLDLLLLEEFVCNDAFSQWFFSQVSPSSSQISDVSEAKRSITQSNGESDLEVWGHLSDGKRFLLLIENKISAGAQPDQAKRYGDRKENYLSDRKTDHCVTVLVAPEAYLNAGRNTAGYENSLSYEQIRDWIQDHGDASRIKYKTNLLDLAIEKRSQGYNPETDMPVTNFWQSYWELCKEIAPELQMPKPKGKPASSRFIRFSPTTTRNNKTQFIHKLLQGNVDIQIDGMAHSVEQIKQCVDTHLTDRMAVCEATGSAAIRIKVPTIDTARSFEEQRKEVEEGITAALELLEWYKNNHQRLVEFIAGK